MRCVILILVWLLVLFLFFKLFITFKIQIIELINPMHFSFRKSSSVIRFRHKRRFILHLRQNKIIWIGKIIRLRKLHRRYSALIYRVRKSSITIHRVQSRNNFVMTRIANDRTVNVNNILECLFFNRVTFFPSFLFV